MRSLLVSSIIAASAVCTNGFSVNSCNGFSTKCSSLQMSNGNDVSRANFLKQAVGVSVASVLSTAFAPSAFAEGETKTLPSGVSYVISKAGDGPAPAVGEMAAIRFRANVEGASTVLDDVFGTPEPYYTRIGSGGLLKGVEEVLPSMRVGDRWVITIPGKLAFGPKGRPASAGKPRIPSDATIIFEVEMVGLPGKEQELIELIGDD